MCEHPLKHPVKACGEFPIPGNAVTKVWVGSARHSPAASLWTKSVLTDQPPAMGLVLVPALLGGMHWGCRQREKLLKAGLS